MALTQPIKSKEDIHALTEYFRQQEKLRDHVLAIMSIHTALRVSDLLKLRWDDVYDFTHGTMLHSFHITEGKTGKTKIVAMNPVVQDALKHYAKEAACPGRFLMHNKRTDKAMSRIQAYRIIRAAAENTLFCRASCHSLRKTFGYHAWQNGISPAVIMEIYNHSSLIVTRRYLGIAQDDLNAAYMCVAMLAEQAPNPPTFSTPTL